MEKIKSYPPAARITPAGKEKEVKQVRGDISGGKSSEKKKKENIKFVPSGYPTPLRMLPPLHREERNNIVTNRKYVQWGPDFNKSTQYDNGV